MIFPLLAPSRPPICTSGAWTARGDEVGSHILGTIPTASPAGPRSVGGAEGMSWAAKTSFVHACICLPAAAGIGRGSRGERKGERGQHRGCLKAAPSGEATVTTGVVGADMGCWTVEESIYLHTQGDPVAHFHFSHETHFGKSLE